MNSHSELCNESEARKPICFGPRIKTCCDHNCQLTIAFPECRELNEFPPGLLLITPLFYTFAAFIAFIWCRRALKSKLMKTPPPMEKHLDLFRLYFSFNTLEVGIPWVKWSWNVMV